MCEQQQIRMMPNNRSPRHPAPVPITIFSYMFSSPVPGDDKKTFIKQFSRFENHEFRNQGPLKRNKPHFVKHI
jgi:hypothetical protein